MKSLLGYGLVGLAAFLLFLVLLAPAHLVIQPLARWLPGVQVRTVEGTATDGVASGLIWRGLRLDRLVWDWRPLSLFSGWLEFQLQATDPEIKFTGNTALHFSQSLRFEQLVGRLGLDKLAVLAGKPGLPLQGAVEFDLRELRLNRSRQPQSADGVVHLSNVSINLGQMLPLGNFTARLQPTDPEGIRATLNDHQGPLILEGTFRLMVDGRYRFDGQAAVRDADNEALRRALSLLGSPDSNGRWALSFSGVLAL